MSGSKDIKQSSFSSTLSNHVPGRLAQFRLWFNVLLTASVNPATARQYDVGWRHWKDFAGSSGVSHLPSNHFGCSCFLKDLATNHMAAPTVLFCAHQFFELGKSASVTSCLSCVAFNLNKSGGDTAFLSNPQVCMVRASLRKL